MSEHHKALVRRLWENVWHRGDAAELAEMLHPDSVNHEAHDGDGSVEGTTRSMFWLRSAFSDQRYEIHQMIAEGDTVAVHLTHSGRHTGDFLGMAPTGQHFSYRHVHIIRFADDRMIEHRAVRDDATLMRQLRGELAAVPTAVGGRSEGHREYS